jgi:DNA-binding beta-propeller fold protein YncE
VKKFLDMKCVRQYLAIIICLVCSLYVQAEQDWEAIACSDGSETQNVCPIAMPQGQTPVPLTPGTTSQGFPFCIAITPDRTRAVVTADTLAFLFDITTSPITQLHSIDFSPIEVSGRGVAITPDGTKAFVCFTSLLTVIDLNIFSVITQIPSSEFGDEEIRQIAISPTKPEAYVVCDTGVRVINTETFVVNPTPISFTGPTNIAVTPDGSAAFVTTAPPLPKAMERNESVPQAKDSHNSVVRIDLSNFSISEIANLFGYSQGIGITPDGKNVCVVNFTENQTNELAIINTQSLEFTSHAITGVERPFNLAISPDGKTAVIDSRMQLPAGLVDFMDIAAGSEIVVSLTGAQESGVLNGIAITPDQAPTARFTATSNGNTVTFDASTSTSPTGTVVLYAWDFGDGQTASTDAPTITHTYANSGDYTVTLTVTNSAGTSLAVTFTGQTVSNNGGPSAQTTLQIAVAAAIDPPSHFKAKVKYRHHKEMIFLKSTWKKSPSPHINKYQIFAYNKKIKTIRAHHTLCSWIHLHPHHVPHHFSKKYREYVHHKYAIRAVDKTGHASTFVPLIVKHQ